MVSGLLRSACTRSKPPAFSCSGLRSGMVLFVSRRAKKTLAPRCCAETAVEPPTWPVGPKTITFIPEDMAGSEFFQLHTKSLESRGVCIVGTQRTSRPVELTYLEDDGK